jgi:biotin carboxyl carrier protein
MGARRANEGPAVVSDLEVRIGDEVVEAPDEWGLEWFDRASGRASLAGPGRTVAVVLEGEGSEWVVTVAGRRIAVTVSSWRERQLAQARGASLVDAGPVVVKATLPGLVVGVGVKPGDEVARGASLVTIEAMKMQNEVRAPRAGRILEVAVAAGQTVATGATLLRLE